MSAAPLSVETLIDARWVIPVEPAGTVLTDHTVAVANGVIVDILPSDVTGVSARKMLGELVAEVVDVVLGGVPAGQSPELLGQVLLRLRHQLDGLVQLHEDTFFTLTAASLTCGCFDTGSHAVSVSSLAAVGRRSSADVLDAGSSMRSQ